MESRGVDRAKEEVRYNELQVFCVDAGAVVG
jgi:hypothetical protein